MDFTFNRVTLPTDSPATGVSDVVRREHANEVWYVPFSPVQFKQQNDWRYYRREDHIVIPLFPYLVPSRPTDALGFAFQLGARAVSELRDFRIRRIHLSLGEPTNQVDDGHGNVCWQFFLGLGVLIEPTT